MTFRLGVRDELLKRLEHSEWWQDLLAYRNGRDGQPLFIAIRDNYLSVYLRGRAVFKKIKLGSLGVRATVDRRYFTGPGGDPGDLVFDGSDLKEKTGEPICSYDGPSSLQTWVSGIENYHPRSSSNKTAATEDLSEKGRLAPRAAKPSVINLEMALPGFKTSRAGQKLLEKRSSVGPARIDMVHLEKGTRGARLVFTEAKLFSNNSSLRSSPQSEGGKASIFDQIEAYEGYLEEFEADVRSAYQHACSQLIAIRERQGSAVDPLLRTAASGQSGLELAPRVKVLIFRENQDRRSEEAWLPHLIRLREKFDVEIEQNL